jgi:hypothetical protein
MTAILRALATRLIKGHWGRIIPLIFKSAGEGKFGEQLKALYWFGEKYATVTGAVLWGIGVALETVCGGYPEWTWTCAWPQRIVIFGQVLASAGLLRGATNSPWPEGAQKGQKEDAKELLAK